MCACGICFAVCICQNAFLTCPCYLSVRNIAKMEDAKVEIDDGKDESEEPDTMYQ